MHPGSKIDAKATLGISGIREEADISGIQGFIRLKPEDYSVALANHVILILDLTASMSGNVKALQSSLGQIVETLQTNRDKCTIIGFAGSTQKKTDGAEVFRKFMRIDELKENIPEMKIMGGTTDFICGLKKALKVVKDLKIEFGDEYPNHGNESMQWNAHNHIAIFMTDGKNYGNVPWNAVEKLKNENVTLHTIGLRKQIDTSVRKNLMKMAKIGSGGFSFSRTMEEFNEKVERLLGLTLNAVTKPTTLRLFTQPNVELNFATILGHPEQYTRGANPEFILPALKSSERKILLFDVVLNKAYPKNTRVPLIKCTSNPNYFADEEILVATPVMPKKNFLSLLSRGTNADLRVHLMMHQIENKLEKALEEAVEKDNIDGFKAMASTSLQNAMERVDEEFAKHPKRPILIEHITELKENIQSAETITDPKEFFSAIYAIMRTTR
jgi:Mg-chelatase subunit ChlD